MNLQPSMLRALVSSFLIGPESRMLHPKVSAAVLGFSVNSTVLSWPNARHEYASRCSAGFSTDRCLDTAGCEAPAKLVSAMHCLFAVA